MNDPFQEVAGRLNIVEAVRRGSRPNDLLPPRREDRVLGETSKRFSEDLRNRVERGRYDPTPISTVFVPKRGLTTRPAALMTLDDRVVFEALVGTLRARIDSTLMGDGIVMWPRGDADRPKRWREFEQSPLQVGVTHVVVADISSFYDSIDHELLRDILVETTGKREEISALIYFLNRVMGTTKGLPQGVEPSDALATVHVTPVDRVMSRITSYYSRHGDDIRIGATSYFEARSALHQLERALHDRGLLLNGEKSSILKRDTYDRQFEERDAHINATRNALFRRTVEFLEDDDEDELLMDLINKAEREDLGWGFFYHEDITFAELVEELSEYIEPSDVEVAAAVFEDAIQNLNSKELSNEEFHQRVTFALVKLAAAKSRAAMPHLGVLVARHSEKVEPVANYLEALASEAPLDVAKVAGGFILDQQTFHTPWARAWMFHILGKVSGSVSEDVVKAATRTANDEDDEWLSRLAAARFLATVGRLSRELARRLWDRAPIVYRTELTEAVWNMRGKADWAEPFLDSLRDDVLTVVKRHLEQESR